MGNNGGRDLRFAHAQNERQLQNYVNKSFNEFAPIVEIMRKLRVHEGENKKMIIDFKKFRDICAHKGVSYVRYTQMICLFVINSKKCLGMDITAKSTPKSTQDPNFPEKFARMVDLNVYECAHWLWCFEDEFNGPKTYCLDEMNMMVKNSSFDDYHFFIKDKSIFMKKSKKFDKNWLNEFETQPQFSTRPGCQKFMEECKKILDQIEKDEEIPKKDKRTIKELNKKTEDCIKILNQKVKKLSFNDDLLFYCNKDGVIRVENKKHFDNLWLSKKKENLNKRLTQLTLNIKLDKLEKIRQVLTSNFAKRCTSVSKLNSVEETFSELRDLIEKNESATKQNDEKFNELKNQLEKNIENLKEKKASAANVAQRLSFDDDDPQTIKNDPEINKICDDEHLENLDSWWNLNIELNNLDNVQYNTLGSEIFLQKLKDVPNTSPSFLRKYIGFVNKYEKWLEDISQTNKSECEGKKEEAFEDVKSLFSDETIFYGKNVNDFDDAWFKEFQINAQLFLVREYNEFIQTCDNHLKIINESEKSTKIKAVKDLNNFVMKTSFQHYCFTLKENSAQLSQNDSVFVATECFDRISLKEEPDALNHHVEENNFMDYKFSVQDNSFVLVDKSRSLDFCVFKIREKVNKLVAVYTTEEKNEFVKNYKSAFEFSKRMNQKF